MKGLVEIKEKKHLRAMDIDALKKELKNAEESLYALQMKLKSNELKQPHLIRAHRRYVALITTLMWEKIFE